MSLSAKLAAKQAAIAAAADGKAATPRPNQEGAKTAPGRLLEAMPLLAQKDQQMKKLEEELEELRRQLQAASNAGADIDLDQLVEVPGRRRKMSKEKYVELRENLRHNKLIHPVVVRRRADGKYEIVSGHHRVDAYREIGRLEIRCVVIEGNDDEITDGAFNANLMQSGLSDYEKYLGFKIRLERTPDLTQDDLAERYGVTQGLVSNIFKFDKLPFDALSVIEEKPEIIGATAAAALANIANQGAADRVIEAIKRLAAGEIDQGQAVRLAKQDPNRAAKPTVAPTSVKIKRGKATYCDLRRAKNVVRLQFKTDEEAERIQAALEKLLESESKAETAEAQAS
ncbi:MULTISPECIES: ParB/RepB/Spo0J family partition protein [Paraburkholderia]|uniref:ParB/RepB/Spo0J family partition protein n=1 Tax=Paraburkholderia TaxID=1822464 RepID=UPI0003FE1D06|nr:ParB/RepB/Spo0J family partition protein [Paraburkholderia mimosarum]